MKNEKKAKGIFDLDDLETEALTLFAGPRKIWEALDHLTEEGELHVKVNPLGDPISFSGLENPTDKDIQDLAAVQALCEKGLVSSVKEQGKNDFVVNPGPKAHQLRNALKRIPKAIREEVLQEVARSGH